MFLEIRDHIIAHILDDDYREGDLLPSVRSLASEFGANPLTVAKAYQTFQDEGLVKIRRGIGQVVTKGGVEKLRNRERQRFLKEEWPEVVQQIKRLKLSADLLLSRCQRVT